jgi:peptide/nickel transport system permease protein
MITYLIKRVLAMIPTLFGITLITFLIVNFAPGDPVGTSMGAGPGGATTEAGGAQDQERMADAIKAKKKLLGMLKEDRGLLAYAPAPASDGVAPMARSDLGTLPAWARALALTPAGELVVAGDHGMLRVVAPDGVRDLPGQTDGLWAIAAHADRVATSSTDGTIVVLPLAGGEPSARVEGSGRPVRRLAFLPDGSLLAVSDEGWVKRFGADGAEQRAWSGHPPGATALALAPDAASFWTGGRDQKLARWRLDADEPVTVVEGHSSVINDVAFSPDGAWLATACDDRKGRLFPVQADGSLGEPVLLEGHKKAVTAVAWLGGHVFTGSRDETVREWATDGRQVGQVPVTIGAIHDLGVSPDGKEIVVAADAWTVVPVPLRFVKWLRRVVVFDFDRSFVDNEPVIHKIAQALPVTLGLNLISILLIYLISVPLGIYAAVRRGGWFDTASSVVVFMLYSMPSFWVATLLIMAFSSVRALNWFPSVGLHSLDSADHTGLQVLADVAWHLVLPVVVYVYGGFASLSRYVRTSMLEVIQQDYVRTARAKGLPERVVVLRHAFRNALVVIVTLLGNLLPAMIGGSVILEYIFTIQGMGLLGFNAILSRDYPVIMAITTLSAVLTLAGVLVSDLLYGVVDPRVRIER